MCRQRSKRPALIRGHALFRFFTRRPDLFGPGVGLEDYHTRSVAEASYRGARQVTRREAIQFVHGPIARPRNVSEVFYRQDSDGVWIGRRTAAGGEKVLTYDRRRLRYRPCRIPLLRRRACA